MDGVDDLFPVCDPTPMCAEDTFFDELSCQCLSLDALDGLNGRDDSEIIKAFVDLFGLDGAMSLTQGTTVATIISVFFLMVTFE